MSVRDLQSGEPVDLVLLVGEVERRQKSDGKEFLRVALGDRTGSLRCMVWDEVGPTLELVVAGRPVRVSGRFEVNERYGPQIARPQFAPAEEGTFDPAQLAPSPPRPADQLEAELRELVATVHAAPLAELLERLLGPESATWERFRDAPAAKHYHQAYRHGLLEHSLTVAQSVGAIAATFPGIDRDIAVTGALLHDIGKTEAYAMDGPAIEMTEAGRLQGEIPLGYTIVRRAMEEVDDFPPELALHLGHIIRPHHGALEHGSPVVPQTREATLVHMLDNLGGRLGSFDRLERALAPGSAWSQYDSGIGASAFFPPGEDQTPAPRELSAA